MGWSVTAINTSKYFTVLIALIGSILCLLVIPMQASADFTQPPVFKPINITDTNLKAQLLITNLNVPTSMAFVGNDILVNELNTGHVRHFTLQGVEKPLAADLSKSLTFLYGIINSKNTVYVGGTENYTNTTSLITKNYVFQYKWNGNTLVNQTLVKQLGGGEHDGGVFALGNDGTVYTINGDAYGSLGPTQNQIGGTLDDTSVIVTVNQPGNVIIPSSAANPLAQYYAIGIRNSFGLAIDPVTGKLWDTENGPDSGDEVNLVPPNFNSGWYPIAGFATPSQIASIPPLGSFVYHDPAFAWEKTVAPTGLTFVQSKPLGMYNNTLIVGDYNNGNLYKFKLNSTRTGFIFSSHDLTDFTDNIGDNATEINFAKGFGGVTSVIQGPDGFLYVVDINSRAIYRIMPSTQTPPDVIYSLNYTVVSNQQINLSWDKPQSGGSQISGYQIYRNHNKGGFTLIASLKGANVLSYSDNDDLETGDTVQYGVRAASSIGQAPFAFTGIIQPTVATVPGTINNLTLSVLSSTQVKLTWTPPSNGGAPITSYHIFRTITGIHGFPQIASISGNATSFTDTTLHPGNTVTYAVKAVNIAGAGPVSNIPPLVTTPTS